MTRSLTGMAFAVILGCATTSADTDEGAPATSTSSSSHTGPNACRLATSGNSPVDQACSEGGIEAAEATMKDLVKRGKAAGVSFECGDCHTHQEDYSRLADDARERFARLIAAARR